MSWVHHDGYRCPKTQTAVRALHIGMSRGLGENVENKRLWQAIGPRQAGPHSGAMIRHGGQREAMYSSFTARSGLTAHQCGGFS